MDDPYFGSDFKTHSWDSDNTENSSASPVQHVQPVGKRYLSSFKPEYTSRQEITKDWVNRISEYRKEKGIHPIGSVLMLPNSMDVSDEMRAYALERNIEIRIEQSEPTKTICPGCGKVLFVVADLCPSCKIMADNSNFM